MSDSSVREKRLWGNIMFLVLAPIALLVALPFYVMENGLSWANIITFVALWWATGLSITAGYHRLFSHRAYRASWPARLFFAVFGAAASQNSAIVWCAAHRYHHRDVDTDGDPYNARRGFLWSHIGWILVEGPRHEQLDNVQDLWADPICRWQHEHYWKIGLSVNLGIPLLVGALAGDLWGVVLFAGLTRVVLLQHTTFCINSLAHMWGSQPWSTANTSRDSWWLSFLTFGEGYHNYHHAFQRDYRNGPLWYNFDPTKWVIWCLSSLGLARDLTRTPHDVVIRRSFEEDQVRFSEWKETLSSRMEALADRVREERESLVVQLNRQVDEAEGRLHEALDELTVMRKRWMRAVRGRQDELQEFSRAEIRELHRAVMEHAQFARERLAEWQERAENMTRSLEALPA